MNNRGFPLRCPKIINEDTIEFLSVWCIPFPALEKLSKKYPDVRFLLDWSNDEEPIDYHLELINGRDINYIINHWNLESKNK